MKNKIINLWTHPRSLSTAFYRTIYERDDFITIFEPFVHMYYKKVFVRKKACKADYKNKKFYTKYNDIRNQIYEKAKTKNVFIKDMAYCVSDYIDEEYLKRSINIFLIRDPAKSLPSFYHILKKNNYFSDKLIKYLPFRFVKRFFIKHVGYSKLWELYRKCNEYSNPLVISAKDFEENPETVMKKFCSYCGIEFKNTLEWEKNQIDDFKFAGTEMFHDNISKSTAIKPQATEYEDNIHTNKLLNKFYKDSIVYFNKLIQHKAEIH